MKPWMWWVVGGAVLYFTRNTWMPWLGIGPGKLPEVAGSGTKGTSSFYQRDGYTYKPKAPDYGSGRPAPPSAGKA